MVWWCDGAGKLPVPGVLLIWIIAGQGPTALAVGAGGDNLNIFFLVYHFSLLFPSLRENKIAIRDKKEKPFKQHLLLSQ